MTLIIAGVQIIPDTWFITEAVNWKNKEFLFNLIKKYKKSGVVFLSGDVHFAQFYSTKCESLTGYDVPEVTSSGITHHVNDFFIVGDHLLNAITNPFWTASDIFVNLNYGLFKIRKLSDDIEIDMQIRDINNGIPISKKVYVNKDLSFNE